MGINERQVLVIMNLRNASSEQVVSSFGNIIQPGETLPIPSVDGAIRANNFIPDRVVDSGLVSRSGKSRLIQSSFLPYR